MKHFNGFRPLEPGEEWSCVPANMPPNTRPLLVGEPMPESFYFRHKRRGQPWEYRTGVMHRQRVRKDTGGCEWEWCTALPLPEPKQHI